ncbi:MAG: right-handed parallel beta-helix repeat-containing protein, partial [Planctomycetaceae bacterium]|nr:right-handed parallel beta-helix repeat-containing protein [Planctomycetaceae bacterium]
SAGNSAVAGLIIVLFGGSGIRLTAGGGDLVTGCFIGTDPANNPGLGNAGSGVRIDNSPGNTIGGTDPGARNIISGNHAFGIDIIGSTATGNVVQGNYIGTNETGEQEVANFGAGIEIDQQASNNLIGGATTAARNLISGNMGEGLKITDSASSNRVQGNYIGTNAEGNGPLSNSGDGVNITDASGNLIGGTDPGMGNLISQNVMYGVDIFSSPDGTDTAGNVVQGNLIGTDASGTVSLGNFLSGVLISNAIDNLIGGTATGAGNVISGNSQYGLYVAPAATGNLIQGNKIGTDISGKQALDNIQDGVFIQDASSNLIGGTVAGAGNVISSNGLNGIEILGDTKNTSGMVSDDLIQGNLIGTDVTGTQILVNLGNGVFLEDASNATIGGTTPLARNIISNNQGDGVLISSGSTSIAVQGNFIGLDGNGITVSGSTDITIGGTETGAGNVIAENEKDGIAIEFYSTGTLVQGNLIGLDLTGTMPLSNLGNGVSVDNSSETTIGGATAAARNIISSNGGDGVKVTNSSTQTQVLGNFIGTDISGTERLSNLGNGVEVTNLAESATIGGPSTPGQAPGNLISGNQGSGVFLSFGSGVGSTVQGNLIGTDLSGTKPLGNFYYGVIISQSAANLVGGATAGAGNVISDNNLPGVSILGSHSSGNVVQGNLIGTDVTGTQSQGNHLGGVSIGGAASGNTIGGTSAPARNLISGNLTDGVMIAGQGTSGNTVEGNFIGTDISGMHPLRNLLRGIFVQDASNNTIGGAGAGTGNLISGNGQDGISITNPSATGNLIVGNMIGADTTGTRIADAGGNLLGNAGNGISIVAAPLNTIALNLISGNLTNGISIADLPVAPGQGIIIIGNTIGSDPQGTLPLGNGGDGILLDTVTNEVIGGPSPADSNLISDNLQAGIEIRGGGSDDIQGNKRLSGNVSL